jgi:hypothetical protein
MPLRHGLCLRAGLQVPWLCVLQDGSGQVLCGAAKRQLTTVAGRFDGNLQTFQPAWAGTSFPPGRGYARSPSLPGTAGDCGGGDSFSIACNL